MNEPLILAIESSCDDTSAAVLCGSSVRSNIVSSQKVHERFGGVVPEMASREHIRNIIPVADSALRKAGVRPGELNAVAFTQSPGLIGSLLVGACFARSLAQSLRLPLIAVHHMRAHVLAHMIDDPKPEFPFLCLTVSGGHTQLVLCRSPYDMEVIGSTIDDAAGEAFDKTAKMLGLPYPGGPMVDKLAKDGDPLRFSFPLSKLDGYRFTFSGIKTSVMYFLQKQEQAEPGFAQRNLSDICASVQHCIIRMLLDKLRAAARDYGVKHIGIAGGVSANSQLRASLEQLGRAEGWQTYIPKFEYCTDNAAMIGIAGYYQYLNGDFADLSTVPSARSGW